MLNITDLEVSVQGHVVLRGVDLHVKAGEVHAIMGPNGAGKSTLSAVLAGQEGYEVTSGTVSFEGEDLLALSAEERAAKGLFLAFQYPVEIPGVSTINFLKTSLNEIRKQRGQSPLDAVEFLALAKAKAKQVKMDVSFLYRSLNEGFSGGEKKRNEIFQMAMLDPKLAVLDETDSGLDIDALKQVAASVNALRRPDNAVVLITHYQRLLRYIVPDRVHVLHEGKIVKSGSEQLAETLEREGYDWIKTDKSS